MNLQHPLSHLRFRKQAVKKPVKKTSKQKRPLEETLSVIASGARSSANRYPRYLIGRVPGKTNEPRAEAFAAEWESLPSGPGLHAVTWLGHCTTLLRIGSLNVLTDPVLSDRIGLRLPGFTIGPHRLSPVPLRIDDLPPIDLVLLSHAHFDHLDKPTLKRIASRSTSVVTAANTRKLIPRGFRDVAELEWGQNLQHEGVLLNAIQPQHWGARTAWDRHRGFNSYLLHDNKLAVPHKVLFAGDTAHTVAFRDYGPLDLAIFGIGAYNPWMHVHATPEQVWEMTESSNAARILPVHHSTFKLSDEPADEPLQRLLLAAGEQGHRVVPPTLGEIHRFTT